MPTYVYRREDGTTFETQQSITEDALDECPDTGQSVERIITGSPGVIMEAASTGSDDARPQSQPSTCSGPLCGL